VISDEEIDEGLERLGAALRETAGG